MYHVEEYEIVSKTYENELRGSEQVASSFPTPKWESVTNEGEGWALEDGRDPNYKTTGAS